MKTPRKSHIRLFLLFALLIPCWVIAWHYEIDLVNLYAAVQFAHNNLDRVYAYNGSLGRYFYGPLLLVLCYPMAYFPFVVVKWAWVVLQTVAYVIFWRWLSKIYPILREERFFWGWVVVWIISINPIHNNYQSNNIQLMIMAGLVLAEVWTKQTRFAQWAAGALVAIISTIKIFPLFIAAFYFVARPRATKIGVLSGFAISAVAPFLFFGVHDALILYQGFIHNLTTYGAENSLTHSGDILCLPSLIARLAIYGGFAEHSNALIKVVTLLISGAFFLGVLLVSRRPIAKNDRYQTHLWAMANALMVFLNPSSRPHYFIFYVPAYCSILEVLYCERIQSKRLIAATIAIATLLIAFTTDAMVGKNLNDHLESLSVPTYGMLLVCLSLFALLWKYPSSLRYAGQVGPSQ